MTNVLLISFDALRYDYVSRSWKGNKTTPFLESVAEDGIQIDNHISTGSGTSTSFPGIHASALPLDHGYAGLNEQHLSLAEVLSGSSIQTIGVTAQTSCSSIYNYDRGYDIFRDWADSEDQDSTNASHFSSIKNSIENTVSSLPVASTVLSTIKLQIDGLSDVYNTPPCPYPQAEEITNETLSIVDQVMDQDDNLFLWVHYMEPHAPYYPPDQYLKQFHDGSFDIGRMRRTLRKVRRARPSIIDGSMIETVSESEVEAFHDFYAAATRYVDDQARRLIRGLSERGVLADSIVVYTADHGEELFDRGTQGHRTKMYDELIRVPLIVEDRSETYQFDSCDQLLTSHLDLAPTIATLFDVEPPDRWRGQSLVETLQAGSVSIDRSHVFSELCHKSGLGGAVSLDSLVASVRSLDWKYIQNRQQGTEELYNLSDDPEESMDVSEENPDILREYQEILERRLKSVSEQSRSVDISENVQEQLEELGYLEDSSS